MGAFENEVKEVIKDKFRSVAEFGRIANLPQSTLSSLFDSGSFKTSSHKTVQKVANALEVDADALMRGKLVYLSDRFKGYVEVPLFGSIAAGQPIESAQTDDRFPVHRELVERYPESFLLRVSGSSMNRILPDGCYALVFPCDGIDHPGQPYVVTVGVTDATVKRVRVLGNGLELVPDSYDPTWRPIVFDFNEDDAQEVRVIGRVVWFCIPINWRFY